MPLSSYWVEPISDDDVVHYGVKGMKWGVRKQKRAYYRGLRQFSRHQKKMSRARNYKAEKKHGDKSLEALDRSTNAADELRKHGYNVGTTSSTYYHPKTGIHYTTAVGKVSKKLTVEQCVVRAEKKDLYKEVGKLLGTAGALSATAAAFVYMDRKKH